MSMNMDYNERFNILDAKVAELKELILQLINQAQISDEGIECFRCGKEGNHVDSQCIRCGYDT